MQIRKLDRDYDALFQEFWPIFQSRPIRDNKDGCQLPQLFSLWIYLNEARPTHVIESGVWLGQTTWLIETACPEAEVISMDPVDRRVFRGRGRFSQVDFALQDFSALQPETTLVFFDDHQHAYKRLMLARAWHFRHVVFEDNYPAGLGDPSIKQLLDGAPAGPDERNWKNTVRALLRPKAPEPYCALTLSSSLRRMDAEYDEMPPLYTPEMTRWGTRWESTYPGVRPCLDLTHLNEEQRGEVVRTAPHYNAMCLLSLDYAAMEPKAFQVPGEPPATHTQPSTPLAAGSKL